MPPMGARRMSPPGRSFGPRLTRGVLPAATLLAGKMQLLWYTSRQKG